MSHPTSSKKVVLCANNIAKTVQAPHGPLTLLSSVNLHVEAGEAVAIIGPSGAGKSTLLSILAGLDTPSSGNIELFNQSIGQMSEDQRAAIRSGKVGFVFQSFQLLDGLTAAENIQLPMTMSGIVDASTRTQKLLKQVGLAERADHFPSQLSGGEQQRVALARAFAISPELLFADEPTGNLDGATGDKIIDQLFAMRDQHNTALLLVTHDMSLAARCDRSLRMQSGRLEAVE